MQEVQTRLLALWKKQGVPHAACCRNLEHFTKTNGADEKMWQASLEQIEGKSAARGNCVRLADVDGTKRFRMHSLEYMKESVGIGAALDLLEEICTGRQRGSNEFIRRLYNEVISKHFCFLDLQKDYRTFTKWRNNHIYSIGNYKLLTLFITQNGNSEEQARMQAVIENSPRGRTAQKRKSLQSTDGLDLIALADVASTQADLPAFDGATANSEGGEEVNRRTPALNQLSKKAGPEPLMHRVEPPGKKRRTRNSSVETEQPKSLHVKGKVLTTRKNLRKRLDAPETAPVLPDGTSCSACDNPASFACSCKRTNFCIRCFSASNFCNLCKSSFESKRDLKQSCCSSCFYPLGAKKNALRCKNCPHSYCFHCAGTFHDLTKCIRCAGAAKFIEANCLAINAMASNVQIMMRLSSFTRKAQATFKKFANMMCHLSRTGNFEPFIEHWELLRKVLAWQGQCGQLISLTQSEIARMPVPIEKHLNFLQAVSVASAEEAAKSSAALALTAGCKELTELTCDKANVAVLVHDASEHPLMDMVAEPLKRLLDLEGEFNLNLVLVLLRQARGTLAQNLKLHYEERGKLLECTTDSDAALLKKLRDKQFHTCLDLVGLAHGSRPAVMQARFCHTNIHYLNYPSPAFDAKAYSHVVLDGSMAAVVRGQIGAECVATLEGPWLNVQHPMLVAGVNRTTRPSATGPFRVMVLGPADRLGPEARAELFAIVQATMEHDVSFGLYRFPSVPFDTLYEAAEQFAILHGIAVDAFVSRLLPYDYKDKVRGNHLNRLREFHLGLILSSVYPPHTNSCDMLVAGTPVVAAGEFITRTCAGSAVHNMMLFAGLGALVAKSLEQLVDFVKQFTLDHCQNHGILCQGIQVCLDYAACSEIGFWNQDRIARSLGHILRTAASDLRQGHVRPIECPAGHPNPDCVVLGDEGELMLVEVVVDAARMWQTHRELSGPPALGASGVEGSIAGQHCWHDQQREEDQEFQDRKCWGYNQQHRFVRPADFLLFCIGCG